MKQMNFLGNLGYLGLLRNDFMKNEDIQKLALECGFSLKKQPSGIMDLNPYVYEFAKKIYLMGVGAGYDDGYSDGEDS